MRFKVFQARHGVLERFPGIIGTFTSFQVSFRTSFRGISEAFSGASDTYTSVLGGYRVVSRRFNGISDALKMPLMLGIQRGFKRLLRFTVGFQGVSGNRLVWFQRRSKAFLEQSFFFLFRLFS